jgi:hypothetical protein
MIQVAQAVAEIAALPGHDQAMLAAILIWAFLAKPFLVCR